MLSSIVWEQCQILRMYQSIAKLLGIYVEYTSFQFILLLNIKI